jgi:hypothetical protein
LSSFFLTPEDTRETETELRTAWPLSNRGVAAFPVERSNYGRRSGPTTLSDIPFFSHSVSNVISGNTAAIAGSPGNYGLSHTCETMHCDTYDTAITVLHKSNVGRFVDKRHCNNVIFSNSMDTASIFHSDGT